MSKWNNIFKLLKPPVFPGDEGKTQAAELINSISLAVLVATILYTVFARVALPIRLFSIVIPLMLLPVGLLILLHRGDVQYAGAGLVIGIWLIFFYASFVNGGVLAPAFSGYIIVVMIAAFLFDSQWGVITAGLSVAAGLLLIFLEKIGALPIYERPLSLFTVLLTQITYFVVAAVLLGLATRNIRKALDYARSNEERYRLIASVMSDYVFSVEYGLNGEIIDQWIGGAFEGITGYTPEEYFACGGWTAILYPDDKEQDKHDMAQLRANQKVVSEIRVVRKDGRIHWVRSYAHPKWDAKNERLGGIYGAVQDITERKQMEDALQISQEKFSMAFHTTPVMMTLEDEDHLFVDVNNAFLKAFGLRRREALGRKASDLNIVFDPGDLAGMQEVFEKDSKLQDFEIRFRRKDNEIGVALLSSEEILLNDRTYTLTSGLDITERKKAEVEREALIHELEKRNAESETLRESAAIVAASLEKAETLSLILEQIASVVPYMSASVQLINGDVLEIVSSRGVDFDVQEIGSQFPIDENEPSYPVIQGQVPYIYYDDVQASVPSFNDIPHNNIRAWMAIPLKVKERIMGIIALDGGQVGQFSKKDAELAGTFANQAAIALENSRLFSELQSELSQKQSLIDELENKNAELERFTYTVSHDLRSPLVTIRGFLGYLERDVKDGNMEGFQKDLQRISRATVVMDKLLKDLLELSRIGRLINRPQDVPFEQLVNDALGIVHGRLEERRVTLHTHPDLPLVHVDKLRLIEVLQNLIDNAAKYMGNQQEPIIEIGMDGHDKLGHPILFVRDNGIGIPMEYQERIFGLFNKLDATSEGTGVGLALVKRIIEFHGGGIWVESEPGKGSTFFFTLPVKSSI